MQVIPQKLSTSAPSMPVVYCKEACLKVFSPGLGDVQNYRHSVFVVLPHDPGVSIRCVRFDDPILFRRELLFSGLFEIGGVINRNLIALVEH